MSGNKKNLFIAWVPFQRRVQTLASEFDLEPLYYHYDWEEKSFFFKLLSYILKGLATLRDIVSYRPDYIFIQLAPTPILYMVSFYCMLTRCRYISDCHNTMIYDDHWIKWPFAKALLRKSYITLVHNNDVKAHSDGMKIPSVILRDPLPVMRVPEGEARVTSISGINLESDVYVIVPCSMDQDEPIEEFFEAARAVPDAKFVVTWFADKLPQELKKKAPSNICFTGFLEEPEFNALYANANAAMVLTTREGTQPSGASEAISLGIPLVVSDINTTRRLYGDNPVYVENKPESISAGVSTALADYTKWSANITALRSGLVSEADQQIADIKARMR